MNPGSHKNHSFARRFGYAWNGLVATWKSEGSFRIQASAFVLMLGVLIGLKPAAIWWALIASASAAVLAAELFNTALENLVDAVHPDFHPLIGKAKDCAAGAVLVLSFAALLIFGALLAHSFL